MPNTLLKNLKNIFFRSPNVSYLYIICLGLVYYILVEKGGPEPQAPSLTFSICYIVQMCQQLIIVVSTGNSLIRSLFDLIFICLTSFCSYMPNYYLIFSLIGLYPIIFYSFAYTSFCHFTSFMTIFITIIVIN